MTHPDICERLRNHAKEIEDNLSNDHPVTYFLIDREARLLWEAAAEIEWLRMSHATLAAFIRTVPRRIPEHVQDAMQRDDHDD